MRVLYFRSSLCSSIKCFSFLFTIQVKLPCLSSILNTAGIACGHSSDVRSVTSFNCLSSVCSTDLRHAPVFGELEAVLSSGEALHIQDLGSNWERGQIDMRFCVFKANCPVHGGEPNTGRSCGKTTGRSEACLWGMWELVCDVLHHVTQLSSYHSLWHTLLLVQMSYQTDTPTLYFLKALQNKLFREVSLYRSYI